MTCVLASDRSVFRQETKDDFCNGVVHLGQILSDINNWKVPESYRDQIDDVQKKIGPLIRNSAGNAYDNFNKVVTVVTNDKNQLDKQLEKCTNDIKSANDKRKDEEKILEENKIQLKTANDNLEHWTREKNNAQSAVERCEGEVRNIEHKKRESEDAKRQEREVTKYTRWLGPFGLVGSLIADGVTDLVTDAEVEECNNKLKHQRNVLQDAENSYNKKSGEVNELQNNKIPNIEKEMRENDKKIGNLNNEVEKLKNAQKDDSLIIEKVKLCLTYVTGISGKAEVLKNSAKNFISVSQVIVPLRDLVENLVKEKSNEFKFLHENKFEAIDDKCKVICKVWTAPNEELNEFC